MPLFDASATQRINARAAMFSGYWNWYNPGIGLGTYDIYWNQGWATQSRWRAGNRALDQATGAWSLDFTTPNDKKKPMIVQNLNYYEEDSQARSAVAASTEAEQIATVWQ